MNLYNYIRSYWTSNYDIGEKLDRCCRRVQAIENIVTDKFDRVETKLSNLEDGVFRSDVCLDHLMKQFGPYGLSQRSRSPSLTRTPPPNHSSSKHSHSSSNHSRPSNHSVASSSSNTSSTSTDGSNLAVFVKPRINNHTQLQYVTGKTKRYNTRKRLYENVDMEKLVDAKLGEPRKKIKRINSDLEKRGYGLTHISDNSLIVDCDCGTVSSVIKDDSDSARYKSEE